MSYRIGLKNGNFLIPLKTWQIPDDLSKAISLKQATQTYFYSRNALLRQIEKGYIQGFKIGRRWYIIPGDLRKHHKASTT